MESTDLINGFKQKARNVSAFISDVETLDSAFSHAVELTVQQGGKTLAAASFSPKEMILLKHQCESKGVELLSEPFRLCADKIHTALTRMDWGIAETGSLLLDSSRENVRIATMLSETHVTLIQRSRIVPDARALETEIDRILKQNQPAYLAWITGASRTADIERVLAIGVHGPKELHILIMKDPEEA
ncbi:MAG: lactate utilization protein [Thermodesulfobacteriota bacterium]